MLRKKALHPADGSDPREDPAHGMMSGSHGAKFGWPIDAPIKSPATQFRDSKAYLPARPFTNRLLESFELPRRGRSVR